MFSLPGSLAWFVWISITLGTSVYEARESALLYADSMVERGVTRWDDRDCTDADWFFQQALKHYARFSGERSERYVSTLSLRGRLMVVKGRYTEALQTFEQVQAIRRKLNGTKSPAYTECLFDLGNAYYQIGDFAKGVSLVTEVLQRRRRELNSDDPQLVEVMLNLSLAYADMGNIRKAENLVTECFKWEAVLGSDSLEFGDCQQAMARLLIRKGDCERAARLLRRVYDLQVRQAEEDAKRPHFPGDPKPFTHRDLIHVQMALALAHARSGKGEQSREVLKQAADNIKILEEEGLPETADNLRLLAETYAKLGDRDKAEASFKRAIAVNKKARGATHWTLREMLRGYAAFLRTRDKPAEANRLEEEARAVGPQRRRTAAVAAMNKLEPSLVTVQDPTSGEPPKEGLVRPVAAVGVVIDAEGTVIAPWKTLRCGAKFEVARGDGSKTPAKLVLADPKLGLAVFKAEADMGFRHAEFADCAQIEVGDPVIAVTGTSYSPGYRPSGAVVSGTNRLLRNGEKVLQVDSCLSFEIGPGLLFDLDGNLAGLLPESEGVLRAIPSQRLQGIVSRLRKPSKVR